MWCGQVGLYAEHSKILHIIFSRRQQFLAMSDSLHLITSFPTEIFAALPEEKWEGSKYVFGREQRI